MILKYLILIRETLNFESQYIQMFGTKISDIIPIPRLCGFPTCMCLDQLTWYLDQGKPFSMAQPSGRSCLVIPAGSRRYDLWLPT